jgi:hypothetical protein
MITEIIEEKSREIMEEEGLEEVSEINNGHCDKIANEVQEYLSKKVSDETWADLTTGVVLKQHFPDHRWTYYNGKHYDAENPEGVNDFRKLEFFKRIDISGVRDNKYTK